MTSDNFECLMIALGFGFGSIFWLLLFYLCFKR